jgi:hypothetical protein
MQNIPAWPGLVTAQNLGVALPELPDQLPDRLKCVPNLTEVTDFPPERLCHGDGDRLLVDIHSDELAIHFHGLPSSLRL